MSRVKDVKFVNRFDNGLDYLKYGGLILAFIVACWSGYSALTAEQAKRKNENSFHKNGVAALEKGVPTFLTFLKQEGYDTDDTDQVIVIEMNAPQNRKWSAPFRPKTRVLDTWGENVDYDVFKSPVRAKLLEVRNIGHSGNPIYQVRKASELEEPVKWHLILCKVLP